MAVAFFEQWACWRRVSLLFGNGPVNSSQSSSIKYKISALTTVIPCFIIHIKQGCMTPGAWMAIMAMRHYSTEFGEGRLVAVKADHTSCNFGRLFITNVHSNTWNIITSWLSVILRCLHAFRSLRSITTGSQQWFICILFSSFVPGIIEWHMVQTWRKWHSLGRSLIELYSESIIVVIISFCLTQSIQHNFLLMTMVTPLMNPIRTPTIISLFSWTMQRKLPRQCGKLKASFNVMYLSTRLTSPKPNLIVSPWIRWHNGIWTYIVSTSQ